MAQLKIDDLNIVSEDLSIEGKVALAQLQLLDQKIEHLEREKEFIFSAHDTSIDLIKRALITSNS